MRVERLAWMGWLWLLAVRRRDGVDALLGDTFSPVTSTPVASSPEDSLLAAALLPARGGGDGGAAACAAAAGAAAAGGTATEAGNSSDGAAAAEAAACFRRGGVVTRGEWRRRGGGAGGGVDGILGDGGTAGPRWGDSVCREAVAATASASGALANATRPASAAASGVGETRGDSGRLGEAAAASGAPAAATRSCGRLQPGRRVWGSGRDGFGGEGFGDLPGLERCPRSSARRM